MNMNTNNNINNTTDNTNTNINSNINQHLNELTILIESIYNNDSNIRINAENKILEIQIYSIIINSR